MKIGMTGGTGFIGQTLLKKAGDEHKLIVATRGASKKTILAEYRQVDYSVSDYVEAFSDCEAVVHLGARIQYDKYTVQQSFKMYENNVTSTENVLNACKKLGITNVILASSTNVYKKDAGVIYSEEMDPNPLNYYGISKVCCEKIGNLYRELYGMNVKNLRFAYVMGVNSSATKEQSKNQLPNIYLNKVVKQEALPVFGKGISANVYIYVKDAVRAIECALTHPELSGTFNIGNAANTSTYELAKSFSSVFDGKSPIVFYPEKKETGLVWSIDNRKAAQLLQFAPAYSIEDAIRDMKIEITEDIK